MRAFAWAIVSILRTYPLILTLGRSSAVPAYCHGMHLMFQEWLAAIKGRLWQNVGDRIWVMSYGNALHSTSIAVLMHKNTPMTDKDFFFSERQPDVVER